MWKSSFNYVWFLPMSSSSNGTTFPCMSKVEDEDMSSWLTRCMLGCTDTPFLASCQCRTRVGHRNGYDSSDSGVRRVSSFFLFFRFSDTRRRGADTAPTRLRRGSDTPAVKKKKENFGIFRVIPANFGRNENLVQYKILTEKKKKSKSKSYLLLLGFVLFFLLIFFLILVSSSSSSSSSSFGFGLLPDYLLLYLCVLAVHLCLEFRLRVFRL